ncbi:MAG: Sua5/YciO/YrdC/YwlC family protein [Gammaproteobacteria bacterium]|nr:Sua5/YciO/YrdC/YwlC family protein [Gammaproteobacteria bacterium]
MSAWHLRLAVRTLRRGGVIAYPTEAVYGLGCLPRHRAAVERILAIKQRRPEKGLILVAGDVSQISGLVDFNGIDRDSVLRTWPGPVTWVLPVGSMVLPWISSRWGSIAVRVSAHPVVRDLCARVGPLVSTSANPGSRPPARSAQRVRAYFGAEVDCILPGRVGSSRVPTEIRDARTGAVLRKGG